jgi:thioredoxin-like negative regulator of GroEL
MRRSLLVAVLAAALVGPGCKPRGGDLNNPSFAGTGTAIEVYERLEQLIEAQKDSKQDREDAYALVVQRAGTDTDYYFARAAVAGRLAENRGLQAMGLVTETEDYARRVRAADPDYRQGAATRMLGTLYVLAPANLVAHGDSETGLELLEAEVKAHPDRIVGRLRLAEAYIALNDPEPAKEHLCVVKQHEAELSAGDRRLLARLLPGVGELTCGPASAAPAEAPVTAPAG